jgi:hypothetical protein
MTKLFAFFLLSLSPSLFAAPAENSRCYRLRVESPETSARAAPRLETWCYENPPELSNGLFIYNADAPDARLELSLLVEPDGTITHGSLLAGKLTIHRVRAHQFNPFSIPLAEPRAPQTLERLAQPRSSSVNEVLERLLAHRSAAVTSFALAESPTAASSSVLPWRGHWWPYKNRPLQRGPYARFDSFVTHRTGSNPGAAAWEDRYHRYKGIWWEGHCNGWAAASVLRAEPRRPRVDAASGIVFSVSDQKAYYTGVDYCVSAAFFGNRYRGGARDNRADITPHLFHKSLVYYLGNLRKPVAMDYRSDVAVDNHVVSGYRFDMRPLGDQLYQVTATLTVHRYDAAIVNIPGVAPTYTRVYKYTLRTDQAGNPVGGTWQTGNPDFLWVPLSSRTCTTNNQNLKREWVDTIMSLPTQ